MTAAPRVPPRLPRGMGSKVWALAAEPAARDRSRENEQAVDRCMTDSVVRCPRDTGRGGGRGPLRRPGRCFLQCEKPARAGQPLVSTPEPFRMAALAVPVTGSWRTEHFPDTLF